MFNLALAFASGFFSAVALRFALRLIGESPLVELALVTLSNNTLQSRTESTEVESKPRTHKAKAA